MSLFTRRNAALISLDRLSRPRHRPTTAIAPSASFTSSSSATNTTSASSSASTSSNNSSSPLSFWDWDRLWKVWDEQSGTAELSLLKRNVSKASQKFDEATSNVTDKRRDLDRLLTKSQLVHARHAALLRTRDQWTSADAGQFADIVAEEVEIKRKLSQAQQDLATADSDLSRRQLEYMDAMRQRYHEEQMWQDKWRVMGTYGTWALIALNSVVFLASQIFFQVREARRLKAIENLINEKMVPIVSNQKEAVESLDVSTSSSSIEEDNGGASLARAETVEQSIDRAGSVESTVSNSDQSREMPTEETDEAPESASEASDESAMRQSQEAEESEASDESTMRQSQEERSEDAADESADGWLMTTWRRSKTAVQRAMSRTRGALVGDNKGSNDKESSKTVVDKVIVRSQDALDALHLPSALFGAALTGTAFLIVILFSKKR